LQGLLSRACFCWVSSYNPIANSWWTSDEPTQIFHTFQTFITASTPSDGLYVPSIFWRTSCELRMKARKILLTQHSFYNTEILNLHNGILILFQNDQKSLQNYSQSYYRRGFFYRDRLFSHLPDCLPFKRTSNTGGFLARNRLCLRIQNTHRQDPNGPATLGSHQCRAHWCAGFSNQPKEWLPVMQAVQTRCPQLQSRGSLDSTLTQQKLTDSKTPMPREWA